MGAGSVPPLLSLSIENNPPTLKLWIVGILRVADAIACGVAPAEGRLRRPAEGHTLC